MATVGDAADQLARNVQRHLEEILPQTRGYSISIEIRENDRKKRSTASIESWNPAAGELVITFGHPTEDVERGYYPPAGSRRVPQRAIREPAVAEAVGRRELITALAEAEQRPGFDFVSLKWFRDLFLPGLGYVWTLIDRDELIRQAIDEGVIMTHKVPNPKSPAFPVSAVSLNRRHPDVQAALGETTAATIFQPIEVRGEPVSNTILRDRR